MLDESTITEARKTEATTISRRGLMQGAVAVAGGALVSSLGSALPAAAQAADAKPGKSGGQIVAASIHNNVAETDSGKIAGYERKGIVVFKGVPYGGSTEGKN